MSADFKRTAIRLRRNQNRVFDFPGGTVEISRTSAGDYWAHISRETSRRTADPREIGTVTQSRIDRTDGRKGEQLAEPETFEHIAIRISTPQDNDR